MFLDVGKQQLVLCGWLGGRELLHDRGIKPGANVAMLLCGGASSMGLSKNLSLVHPVVSRISLGVCVHMCAYVCVCVCVCVRGYRAKQKGK